MLILKSSWKVVIPALILVTVSALLFVFGAEGRGPDKIHQPIQFSHQFHIKEWDFTCDMCHQHVLEEEYAGRPRNELCAGCHTDPIGDSSEEALLVEYVRSETEVPWRRLYNVPNHVYFSHRRHVTVAKIECAECHGDIGLSTSPPDLPLVDLKMKLCLTCHEKQGVTTDCDACHR